MGLVRLAGQRRTGRRSRRRGRSNRGGRRPARRGPALDRGGGRRRTHRRARNRVPADRGPAFVLPCAGVHQASGRPVGARRRPPACRNAHAVRHRVQRRSGSRRDGPIPEPRDGLAGPSGHGALRAFAAHRRPVCAASRRRRRPPVPRQPAGQAARLRPHALALRPPPFPDRHRQHRHGGSRRRPSRR